MVPFHYVWLVWALSFLIPWFILYLAFPRNRRLMLTVSIMTLFLGFTEPLFVPSYWNPPSLFNLAERTGFDIESFIFCFALGGVGVVLYLSLTERITQPICLKKIKSEPHYLHCLALLSPGIIFLSLYWLNWNVIFPAIISVVGGAIFMVATRRDLFPLAWKGGFAFLIYYFVFIMSLDLLEPGYIEQVWVHKGLLGAHFFTVPVEEFIWAFGVGMYWSTVYEFALWRKVKNRPEYIAKFP